MLVVCLLAAMPVPHNRIALTDRTQAYYDLVAVVGPADSKLLQPGRHWDKEDRYLKGASLSDVDPPRSQPAAKLLLLKKNPTERNITSYRSLDRMAQLIGRLSPCYRHLSTRRPVRIVCFATLAFCSRSNAAESLPPPRCTVADGIKTCKSEGGPNTSMVGWAIRGHAFLRIDLKTGARLRCDHSFRNVGAPSDALSLLVCSFRAFAICAFDKCGTSPAYAYGRWSVTVRPTRAQFRRLAKRRAILFKSRELRFRQTKPHS